MHSAAYQVSLKTGDTLPCTRCERVYFYQTRQTRKQQIFKKTTNFNLNQLKQRFEKLQRYFITKECTTGMVTLTIELLSRLRLVNLRLLHGKMEKQADLGKSRP